MTFDIIQEALPHQLEKLRVVFINATEETVFARQDWNEKWNEAFGSQLEDYFDPNKGLNLQRVFILTETTSASASELLINGLDPHMQVIHIGDTTRGKNEFSITLVDDVSGYSNFPFLYHPSREPYINSNVHGHFNH